MTDEGADRELSPAREDVGSGPHRTVRIPKLMRLVRGPAAVLESLAELTGPGDRLLVAHSGGRSATGYGATLTASAAANGWRTVEVLVTSNDEASVQRVTDAIARTTPRYVIGVGGGRVVDVAKLGAARTGTEVITIPTQFASDAICSPIAIVRDAAGAQLSLGARMPIGIVTDLDVVDRAPRATWRAGLGDLVSNVSAVRDWRLAHARWAEPFDDFACLTAEAAALSVVSDQASLDDAEYRQSLIRGLILSGIAMEMAGSSRPASGSEHLISHALDGLLASPHPHGLQVAVGTIAAGLLRGDDISRLVNFYRRVGLPVRPDELGIDVETLVAAVRGGPATRPGRRTMLDSIDDEAIQRLRDGYQTLVD